MAVMQCNRQSSSKVIMEVNYKPQLLDQTPLDQFNFPHPFTERSLYHVTVLNGVGSEQCHHLRLKTICMNIVFSSLPTSN